GLWIGNDVSASALLVVSNATDPVAPVKLNKQWVQNVNTGQSGFHARLFQVYGCATSDGCGGKDIYGNLIAIFGQTRGSTRFLNTITNLKLDHTEMYSAIECQVFEEKV